jgi:hypothetical protein
LDGCVQPFGGPAIAECRQLCSEARFDNFSIGGRQGIFGGQASMGPAGRGVSGLKSGEFGDQPVPQRRRLIGG